MANIAQEEALMRQVAALELVGMSQREIAKQLGVAATAVAKAKDSPRYMEIASEGAEREFGPALVRARAKMSKLLDKAVARIEKVLDSGGDSDGLKAASMILKVTGLEQQEQKTADTSIQVFLGNSDEPKVIEVESNEV